MMFDNEKIIYKNDWDEPVMISKVKIENGVYLLIGRRYGGNDNKRCYYHMFFYLAYGKHSLRMAERLMIKNTTKSSWNGTSSTAVFKNCQRLNLGPYGDEDLISRVTGKFMC